MAKRVFTGVFIPAKIWESSALIPAEKMLLGEITALSEDTGYCYASRAHFADWLHCTPQNVTYYLGKLEKLGFLIIERTPGERSKIVVNKAKFYGTSQPDLPVNPTDGSSQPDLPPPVNPTDGSSQPDLPEIKDKYNNKIQSKEKENLKNDFPNPSNNPPLSLKEEEKKKKVAPAPGAAKPKKTRTGRDGHTWSETLAHLQDNDPAMYMWAQQTVKIWDDWMEYRIENKKCTPYGSAKTEAIAVKQLHKLAEGKENNARAIVEYVRANGYQGLYLPPELKQQPNQSGYKRQEKQGVNPYNYG